MIRSLFLAAAAVALSTVPAAAQIPERVSDSSPHFLGAPGTTAGIEAPRLGPAMPERGSRVPVLPQEASVPSFARTALLSSIGSFAGLFGGAITGFGLSGGAPTGGAVVMTFTGSVVGAAWVGGKTSGRGGQAVLGSILGSAAGMAFLASAQPEGFSALITYSVIHGITTAVATSF